MILYYLVTFLFILHTVDSACSPDNGHGDTYVVGDMLFSKKIDEMRSSVRAGATFSHNFDISWPNNTIPYTWQLNISAEKKAMIQNAMKDIMNAVPNCWKFVEKTTKHKHWVEYNTERDTCSSHVGNQDASGYHPQVVNFGADFCKLGSMVHELFHTMGFMHEMTRNDRDEYIEVFFDHIPKWKLFNFLHDREKNYVTEYYGVPYSFDSIMHYGLKTYMRNKKNRKAAAWDWPNTKIGQRYQFSRGDLLMMARKGKCPDPKIMFYPITGAMHTDVDISEDMDDEPGCRMWKCVKNPPTCQSGENTLDEICDGKCGKITRQCCKNYH